MIAVVQRVTKANVVVAGQEIGRIDHGLAVLAAVCADDRDADVIWTANKIVGLRIFRNGEKHFDLDVRDVGGAILLVSNFTVAGETRKGRRPSLDRAAGPETAKKLFEALVSAIRSLGVNVATGEFGGDMKVSLVNDGPATFIVDSRAVATKDGGSDVAPDSQLQT